MSAEDGAPLADVPFIKAPMPDRRDFPREVRVGNEKCDYCGQPGIQFGDVLVCIDHAAKVDTHRYTPSEVESLVQQVAECEWLLRITMDARDRAERQAERLEARIARTVEGGRAQMRDACLLSEERRRRAESAEAKIAQVSGLLAAYGDAEGTLVDYEFLVHHLREAIRDA